MLKIRSNLWVTVPKCTPCAMSGSPLLCSQPQGRGGAGRELSLCVDTSAILVAPLAKSLILSQHTGELSNHPRTKPFLTEIFFPRAMLSLLFSGLCLSAYLTNTTSPLVGIRGCVAHSSPWLWETSGPKHLKTDTGSFFFSPPLTQWKPCVGDGQCSKM